MQPLNTASPVIAPSTPSAGTKRKRETKDALKFYAVRVGKAPGIYCSWNECLEQVRGFPKAAFKSFTSLADAESFVENDTNNSDGRTSKWYGVQAGRIPGVYTNWQDVLDQITGWRGPKHKGFSSKAEAEAYVAQGKELAASMVAGTAANIEASEPAQKKAKAGRPKKSGGLKESSPTLVVEQGEYEPGEAPLPAGSIDGFDPTITIDHTTNGARYKTRDERSKTTLKVSGPVKEAPIRIYTDGSSLSNGQIGAMGGVGVYFGPGDNRNVSEPLSGTKQTNQRAELTAIARALEIAPRDRRIVVVSDSKYAIDCVTDWFQNWQRREWVTSTKKPVENKDLVVKILDLLEERKKLNAHRSVDEDEETVDVADKRSYWNRGPAGVRFEWVKGHDKDEGNNAADVLAQAGARSAKELYGDADI